MQAAIFDELFWTNVTLTLLPLLVLLGVVALIYFDLSWLWPKTPDFSVLRRTAAEKLPRQARHPRLDVADFELRSSGSQ